MRQESLLYGIIGLLTGGLLMGVVAISAVNNNHSGMMNMMGMRPMQNTPMNDDSMGMDQMTANLRGKTGDDFDKLFISEMIVHHQGAIDMANLAKQSAKHEEIKTLADAIIVAQTKEITEMQQWQKNWNYPVSDSTMDGMHSRH